MSILIPLFTTVYIPHEPSLVTHVTPSAEYHDDSCPYNHIKAYIPSNYFLKHIHTIQADTEYETKYCRLATKEFLCLAFYLYCHTWVDFLFAFLFQYIHNIY